MAFDPTKPAYRTEATSAELRDNFVALAQHHRGSQVPAYAQLGWIWLDTADSDNWKVKVYTRHGSGALSWKTLFDHAERTPYAGSDVEQQQLLYVGKHGVDTNNGKSPGRAFLTFGAAITAAGTPASEAAAVTIACLDNGTYTEDVTGVPWVNIYAPSAKLMGMHAILENSFWVVGHIYTDDSKFWSVYKNGTGPAKLIARTVTIESWNGIYINEGDLILDVRYMAVHKNPSFNTPGIFLDATAGDLTLDIGEMELIDVDTFGIVGTTGHLVYGTIGALIGAGTGLRPYGAGCVFDLHIGRLACTKAYACSTSAVLNLVAGSVSGTREEASGSFARVTEARRDGTKAGVPNANDDENDGYSLFSMVYDSNAGDMYVCCDPSAGAAVWKKITP